MGCMHAAGEHLITSQARCFSLELTQKNKGALILAGECLAGYGH